MADSPSIKERLKKGREVDRQQIKAETPEQCDECLNGAEKQIYNKERQKPPRYVVLG